ncbi:MAG TPA: methyltransferase domain-containing protein [Solirubrobacterales bacterium]|jgi:ubiquinone/menaquinone biosynthesis C-methylase UbiE
MSEFLSPAEHYDRYMGRYTVPLARALADAVGVREGMRVLDVGCGPGGLTSELAGRVGAENVAAIDPAEQFVAACRERNPGADVRQGVGEELPWGDDEFDAALSCLVIAFMRDADAAMRQMARVTRPGGRVGVCMWDIGGGGMTMLRLFWGAMKVVKPETEGELPRVGTSEGEIAERVQRAGLRDIAGGALEVSVEYSGFDDFWKPFTFAVGPSGQAFAKLEDDAKDAVREKIRAELPDGRFSLDARAWYATATA